MEIVFTDVDGTFVGDDHHALPQSAPAVQRVASRVPFCLVSARSPEGLYHLQRDLGFQGPLACFSGAYVLDHEGAVLYSATMPTDLALQVKDYVTKAFPQVVVGTYGFDHWIVDDEDEPRIRHEEKLVRAKARACTDLIATFGTRGVHKLLLMGEPSHIAAAQQELSERFAMLNVVRSSKTLCEVMSREASKSHAVEVVCAHYGTTPERAVAFGDGPNDIDMLQSVGTSYAMANAEDSVKAVATRVLPWTNQQCGVARKLDELLP